MPDIVMKVQDALPTMVLGEPEVKLLVDLYDSDAWNLHWEISEAVRRGEVHIRMADEKTNDAVEFHRAQGSYQWVERTLERIGQVRKTWAQMVEAHHKDGEGK